MPQDPNDRRGLPPRPRLSGRSVDLPRRRVVRTAFFALGVSQWMVACGGSGGSSADTSAPTSAPTTAPSPPTTTPSPGGTPAPTSAPTTAPTPAPTSAPGPSPTFAPTPTPVVEATAAPTPAPAAASLPGWVPLAGNVVTLNKAKGTLTNNFRDTCPVYYDASNSVHIVNDYSSAFKNPYWGTWGCQVFFGGGHAGTNNNMVVVAEYGMSAITFKRVCDPTPWFGTSAAFQIDNATGNANPPTGMPVLGGFASVQLNATYYDSTTADGKVRPGSPHSYASGDIIGPEYGGATNGTYIQVIAAAVNHANDGGAVAAHRIDFSDTTSAPSARSWQRVTNATGDATFGDGPAPLYTAFVGPQNRIYITPNGPNVEGRVRWFDLTTKTWVNGTGVGFSNGESDGFDSGIKFYVPSRNLLVFIYPLDTKLKVQWMDVSKAQPTLGTPVTLSLSLTVGSTPAATNWSAACWCPLNNRIIVAGANSDNAAVYEITIPTLLSNIWVVERAAFGAGQTLMPPDNQANYGVTWKKFHYDEKVRAIVYMPLASPDADDTVWVYRPRYT